MCTSGELGGRPGDDTGPAGAAWHEVTQAGKPLTTRHYLGWRSGAHQAP